MGVWRETCCLLLASVVVQVAASPTANALDDDPTPQDEFDREEDFTYPKSWIVVNFLTGILISLVCLLTIFCIGAVARFKLSSFNTYLIFILAPDAMLNGIYAISSFWEATHEGVYDPALCSVRNWFSYFYYFANLHLNAVVAREIYILVRNSYQRLRTPPPSRRRVALQIGRTYLYTAILSTWIVLDTRWSPFTVIDMESCLTVAGSAFEDPVFNTWTAIIVAMVIVGAPFLYVFYVGYQIWKQKLLPIKGRTRTVALYFFRIVFIFVLFYIPNVGLAMVFLVIPPEKYSTTAQFWAMWGFTLLIPGQCLATIKLVLMKEDVAYAVQTMRRRSTVVLMKPWNAMSSGFFFTASSSAMESGDVSGGLFRRRKSKDSDLDESKPFGTTSNQSTATTSSPHPTSDNPKLEDCNIDGNGILSEWEEEDIYEEDAMDARAIEEEDEDN